MIFAIITKDEWIILIRGIFLQKLQKDSDIYCFMQNKVEFIIESNKTLYAYP